MPGWSVRKTLLLMVGANLLLGAALLGMRAPGHAATVEVAPRPELPAQIQQLQLAINGGRHGQPYALVLSDSDLTALAGYALASRSNLPFDRLRVAVRGQRIVVDAITRGLALALPVRATATTGAVRGTPWVRVEDVSLGDAQVPGFIRDEVLRQANAGLDLSTYDLAITVDALELREGGISMRGTIK